MNEYLRKVVIVVAAIVVVYFVVSPYQNCMRDGPGSRPAAWCSRNTSW